MELTIKIDINAPQAHLIDVLKAPLVESIIGSTIDTLGVILMEPTLLKLLTLLELP
jgi:hypothetical protein